MIRQNLKRKCMRFYRYSLEVKIWQTHWPGCPNIGFQIRYTCNRGILYYFQGTIIANVQSYTIIYYVLHLLYCNRVICVNKEHCPLATSSNTTLSANCTKHSKLTAAVNRNLGNNATNLEKLLKTRPQLWQNTHFGLGVL